MALPSTGNRLTLFVASAAYAGALLVTVVETPPTARTLVGAVVVFALSIIAPIKLAEEHDLRLPAAAFFGAVTFLLAAAYWRAGGSVDAFVAMVIHLLGLFVVAAVATGELFLQALAGARNA